jgi:NAD(P)-dependent dehydrogenase (short-subunit alcohol dehydrogenase family)
MQERTSRRELKGHRSRNRLEAGRRTGAVRDSLLSQPGRALAALQEIRELGTEGFVVQADVCQPDEVRRIFQKVCSEFGSLDIFVNNARTKAPTFYEPRWRSH